MPRIIVWTALVFVWAALVFAVVAEGLALIRLGNKSQSLDDQIKPNSCVIDERAIASLETRLRAIEEAQAGGRAKTDEITKLLSNFQAHASARQHSGGKQKPNF